jgi:hypothetical protein
VVLSELEAKRYDRLVGAFVEKRRPPPHIRPKLDFGYRFRGQSVEIFELRPRRTTRERRLKRRSRRPRLYGHKASGGYFGSAVISSGIDTIRRQR